MNFDNNELLDIAYAITLSMPEGETKESILDKIDQVMIKTGTTEQNQKLSAINGVPGRKNGEDWFDDLEKHRQFYWSNIPEY